MPKDPASDPVCPAAPTRTRSLRYLSYYRIIAINLYQSRTQLTPVLILIYGQRCGVAHLHEDSLLGGEVLIPQQSQTESSRVPVGPLNPMFSPKLSSPPFQAPDVSQTCKCSFV